VTESGRRPSSNTPLRRSVSRAPRQFYDTIQPFRPNTANFNFTKMPSSTGTNSFKKKGKPLPPQPAMFKLHSPVVNVAPPPEEEDDDDNSSVASSKSKVPPDDGHAKGGTKPDGEKKNFGVFKPAAVTSDDPRVPPTADTAAAKAKKGSNRETEVDVSSEIEGNSPGAQDVERGDEPDKKPSTVTRKSSAKESGAVGSAERVAETDSKMKSGGNSSEHSADEAQSDENNEGDAAAAGTTGKLAITTEKSTMEPEQDSLMEPGKSSGGVEITATEADNASASESAGKSSEETDNVQEKSTEELTFPSTKSINADENNNVARSPDSIKEWDSPCDDSKKASKKNLSNFSSAQTTNSSKTKNAETTPSKIHDPSSPPSGDATKETNPPSPRGSINSTLIPPHHDFRPENDSDDEGKYKYHHRMALKRPRNSASAIAYAKKMREKELQAQKEKAELATGKKTPGRPQEKAEKVCGSADKGEAAVVDGEATAEGSEVQKVVKTPKTDKKKNAERSTSKVAPSISAELDESFTNDDPSMFRRPKRARLPSMKALESTLYKHTEVVGESGEIERKEATSMNKSPALTIRRGSKRLASASDLVTEDPAIDESSKETSAEKPTKRTRRSAWSTPSKKVATEELKATKSSKGTSRNSAGDSHPSVKNALKVTRNLAKRNVDEGSDMDTKLSEKSSVAVSTRSTRRFSRVREAASAADSSDKDDSHVIEDKSVVVDHKSASQSGTKKPPTYENQYSDDNVSAGKEGSVVATEHIHSSEIVYRRPTRAAKALAIAAMVPDSLSSANNASSTGRRHSNQPVWSQRLPLLRAYYEKYGTCDLNAMKLAGDGKPHPDLKNFVAEIRKQYRKWSRGEASSLTQERVQTLLDMEFNFFPNESGTSRSYRLKRHQELWEQKYAELVKYKEEHGDTLVPCIAGVRSPLANWVRGQRKFYKKVGRAGFPEDRLKKLEAIEFDFNPMKSGDFIKKKKEGNRPKVEATWEKWFAELLRFKKENNNLHISPKDDRYPRLYDWIHLQRKEYKKYIAGEKSRMCEDWVNKMKAVGFDFAPMQSENYGDQIKQRFKFLERHHELWNRQYENLKKFHKKHGHCYVFRNSKDGITLANWIHCQRKQRKLFDKGEHCVLTPERIRLLDDINFDWAPSKSGAIVKMRQKEFDEEWESKFRSLCNYKRKEGHCKPSKDVPKLGVWCKRMRSLYAKNKAGEKTTLTQEKTAKLESIGFEFEPTSTAVSA